MAVSKSYIRKTICLFTLLLTSALILLIQRGFKLSKNWKLEPFADDVLHFSSITCTENCQASLVESIPEGLAFPVSSLHLTTYSALMNLIKTAEQSIEIASFYWTLQRHDITPNDATANQGQAVFDALLDAGQRRHVDITIVKKKSWPLTNDTFILKKYAGASVYELDLNQHFGGGIIHTKFWIVDRKHFYIGSANVDWRALTQDKELGVTVKNCSCLAKDLGTIFNIYVHLARRGSTLPKVWPANYNAAFNASNPFAGKINGVASQTYISSSPPKICSNERTTDLEAILKTIQSAKKFIYIAVMDYYPTTRYLKHNTYWPVIDQALRSAVFDRGVTVLLLASLLNHTSPRMYQFLHSLADMNSTGSGRIEVKMFVVPTFTQLQAKIPYIRINHNKYMVTETTAFIGTSNWSGDYFINTAGIAFVTISEKLSIRHQLEKVFTRDWESPYTIPVLTNKAPNYQEVNDHFMQFRQL